MNGNNILSILTQHYYDEVGWVLNEHGYMVEPGDDITPDLLADALSETGFNMAADITNLVNETAGETIIDIDDVVNATPSGVAPYVDENVQVGQTGLFITWDALGWGFAAILLIMLIFRK